MYMPWINLNDSYYKFFSTEDDFNLYSHFIIIKVEDVIIRYIIRRDKPS